MVTRVIIQVNHQWFFQKKNKKKSNFEPLLRVCGAYIVSNTIRKVGLLVKMSGQPSMHNKRFQRYGFLPFLPKFPPIIFQKGSQITRHTNIFCGNNLNYLEDTLGDLEPQLEFYHRDGVGGHPLGPGL